MIQAVSGRRGRSRRSEGSDLGVQPLSVDPRATNPAIADWVEPHLIFHNPEVAANGCLFVFLAGSNGIPGRQTLLLNAAAQMGYRAINLRYPNSWTVGGLCRKSSDPDCHEKIRLQITEGLPGELPGALPHESIHHRLGALLEWLGANDAGAGWEEYLRGGEVVWERVVLAGHSQGGGHAALLGKRYRMKRVVMLGSPVDHWGGTPSAWLARPGATPPERFFGFAHAFDQGIGRIDRAWEAIGLARFGGLVNADSNVPPYSMSHQLVSSAPVQGGKFHASVAVDAATPISSEGSPLYAPVWRYLLDEEPAASLPQ